MADTKLVGQNYVTPDLLAKLGLFGKDLTEFSLDTVRMFHRDAGTAGYSL